MIVSNTEVSTFNLCEYQHDIRFNRSLEPRYLSVNTPLGMGILGHEAFEAYYLEMLEGSPVETSLKAARAVLEAKISWIQENEPEEFQQLIKIAHLIELFEAYAEFYRQEPFRVLAVEKVYQTNIAPGIEYGLKLDLLVEWLKGIDAGELVIIDHKFVYNFKSRAELEMDCQLPKYTKTLRDNGLHVSHSIFNQVRYRELKAPGPTDVFLRMRMDSSPRKIKNIWAEQRETAEKIKERREGTSDENPVRTLHILACRYCLFQGLCETELDGRDSTSMQITDFKDSTYGYVDMTQAGDIF